MDERELWEEAFRDTDAHFIESSEIITPPPTLLLYRSKIFPGGIDEDPRRNVDGGV